MQWLSKALLTKVRWMLCFRCLAESKGSYDLKDIEAAVVRIWCWFELCQGCCFCRMGWILISGVISVIQWRCHSWTSYSERMTRLMQPLTLHAATIQLMYWETPAWISCRHSWSWMLIHCQISFLHLRCILFGIRRRLYAHNPPNRTFKLQHSLYSRRVSLMKTRCRFNKVQLHC